MRRVVVGQVDIADGVINLVLVVFVFLVSRHAPQLFHHFAVVSCGHGFGLQDLCVEGKLIGRVAAYHPFQCFVGFRLLAGLMAQLAQQEVQARFLQFVPLFPDGLLEVGDSVFVLLHEDEIIRIRGVEFAFPFAADAVAADFLEHVFCVVRPFHFHVAAGQPGTGYGRDFRLRGIQRVDIVEERGGFDEIALLELRFPHEQPGMAQEGVELFACQVGLVLGRFPSVRVGLRACLDGVKFDGLFAFLDGRLEFGLAECGGGFVAHVVHGQQLGVVVLVSVLLCQYAFLECLAAVEVGVEPCGHGVVKARSRRVLLRGTRRQDAREGGHADYDM